MGVSATGLRSGRCRCTVPPLDWSPDGPARPPPGSLAGVGCTACGAGVPPIASTSSPSATTSSSSSSDCVACGSEDAGPGGPRRRGRRAAESRLRRHDALRRVRRGRRGAPDGAGHRRGRRAADAPVPGASATATCARSSRDRAAPAPAPDDGPAPRPSLTRPRSPTRARRNSPGSSTSTTSAGSTSRDTFPIAVDPRRRRHRELLARLLPARHRPVRRAHDAQAEPRAQEEPQAASAARAVPRHPHQAVLRPRLPDADAQVRAGRAGRCAVRGQRPRRCPTASTRCRPTTDRPWTRCPHTRRLRPMRWMPSRRWSTSPSRSRTRRPRRPRPPRVAPGVAVADDGPAGPVTPSPRPADRWPTPVRRAPGHGRITRTRWFRRIRRASRLPAQPACRRPLRHPAPCPRSARRIPRPPHDPPDPDHRPPRRHRRGAPHRGPDPGQGRRARPAHRRRLRRPAA